MMRETWALTVAIAGQRSRIEDALGFSPQSILLPVLGILAVTAEWSQRIGRVTFTLEPSRIRIAVAKLVAVVRVGLLALLRLGLVRLLHREVRSA